MSQDVFLGYVHGETVHHCFLDSLLRTISTEPRIRAIQPVKCGAMSLDRGRNGLVEKFLALEDADWLLMIDTDMGWDETAISRLLATADVETRPVVGALCFRIEGFNADIGAVLGPTVIRFAEDGTHYPVLDYSGVEKVDVTGAAFLLIHRWVLERLERGRWFSHHPSQDTTSEDWAFCMRLRDAGIPLHVDTDIKIGHAKTVVFEEREYRNMLQRVAALPDVTRPQEWAGGPMVEASANRATRRARLHAQKPDGRVHTRPAH